MREHFQNLEQMQQWLKQAAGMAVVAIGIQGSFSDLYTNMTSPVAVASAIQAVQQYSVCDSNQPCFVDYEPAEGPDPFPGLDYEQFIAAFVVKVTLASNGKTYGGLENLLQAIPEQEVLICMRPPEPGYHLGYVLIKMPKDPFELSKIKESLHQHSISYTIPDGSGEMSVANTTFGNGLNPFNGTA